MKKLTLFLSLLFFLNSTPSHSQQTMMMKKQIEFYYNSSLGDWEPILPIPDGIKVIIGDFILIHVAEHNVTVPGVITKRGFEFIHPSILSFTVGFDYTFLIKFRDADMVPQPWTYPMQAYARGATLSWSFNYDEDENFVIDVTVSNVDGLEVDLEHSWLSFVSNSSNDTIIFSDPRLVHFERVYGNTFRATYPADKLARGQQWVGMFFVLNDALGNPRMYVDRSSAFFFNNELNLKYKIDGEGGIVVYFADGQSRNYVATDMSGKILKSGTIESNGAFWLPSQFASGFFILKVDGYKPKKIPKIRT